MTKQKFDTSKYIEIPFKNRGRDFDGCDCWGLARLIYMNEYNISLPSFVDVYKDASEGKRVSEAIVNNKKLVNYVEHVSPEYGDICVFNINGSPAHVGVYVGKQLVLHVLKGTNSCCERLSSVRLKGRVEGFYGIS